MPYVNIKVAGNKLTPEEKARVISGVTKVLEDELGKPAKTTYVIIEEVNTDNWGVGGETITVRRQKQQ